MMVTKLVMRSVLMAAVGVAMAVPVRAQLARPRTADPNAPKLLVTPFWYDTDSARLRGLDSASALLVADGVRDRLRTAHGTRFNTISRQNMCENLQASGFPCDVPLDAHIVRQLARFLNARFVIEGTLGRGTGDSMYVAARLYETAGQAPQSANVVVATTRQRIGTSTGTEIANRLVDAFQSFDEVQDCNRRREAGDFDRAWRRAQDALRQYPNNASAYLCMALILEAQNQSADTVIATLRQAYERDTLNTIVMRRLANKYQDRADTNALVDMLKRILTIDRRDNDLRINTAQLLVRMNRAQDALIVINQGLERNPASLELLSAKSIAYGALSVWDSAAATLAQVGDIDSSTIDSLFLFRITNYLRNVPDTTGLFRWTQRATVRLPGQANYWFDLSTLAIAQGDTTLSMDAARQYLQLRPEDGRAHLLLARPLAALAQMDSALSHADLAGRDSTLRVFSGLIYLQAGLQSLRDTAFATAAERLQRARDWIPNGGGTVQQFQFASYYLGFSQVRLGIAADNEAQNTRSCEAVRRAQQLWPQAEANIIAGVAVNREQANQLLQAIAAYRQRADQMAQNFRCPEEPPAGG